MPKQLSMPLHKRESNSRRIISKDENRMEQNQQLHPQKKNMSITCHFPVSNCNGILTFITQFLPRPNTPARPVVTFTSVYFSRLK